MTAILILAVIAAACLVLVALARGLYHFSQGHQATIDGTVDENHVMQNRMMISRVKWQAITVLLLVAIAFVAGAR